MELFVLSIEKKYHRLGDHLVAHVVQKYVFGAGVGGFFDLVQIVRFDLDLQVGIGGAGLVYRPKDRPRPLQRRQFPVIVLDHDPVEQPDAVIGRAADGNGVFFQIAESGGGFAGVENNGFAVGKFKRVPS